MITIRTRQRSEATRRENDRPFLDERFLADCKHKIKRYAAGSLCCMTCTASGLESEVDASEYPATFTEEHTAKRTGWSVTKVNNHVDRVTFFNVYDENNELKKQTVSSLEALVMALRGRID